jgi:fatty acid desaturase
MREDRVPDVDRGPTRPLTERAARLAARSALTDRKGRFAERFEAVQAAEARRRRREQLVERATVLAILVGTPLLGWWAATWLGVTAGTGVAVGIPAGVVVVLVRRWLARYAEHRGATSWDWQRRRHVVHGDPSRSVQSMTGRGPLDRRR